MAELGARSRDAGAAALLYTDVSRDGTETRAQRGARRRRSRATIALPVLASGGVGRAEHIAALAAVADAGSRASVVGRALYTGAVDPRRRAAARPPRRLLMLAKRVIPCLDVKDGRVVKGVRFVELRDAGDPVEAALAYDAQGADELVFLDITASHEDRAIMLDVVRRTAEGIYMPLTVGGGMRTVDDVRRLLRAGADKVSLNTAALERPAVIREAAERFGSQCIVVAIDARRTEPATASNRPPTLEPRNQSPLPKSPLQNIRCTRTAAAGRPGATPSSGRRKPSRRAPARSC